MYRQSKRTSILDSVRPTINLRSNKKVKFKKQSKYRYTMYLKSPTMRGMKVWDMLPATVQKATTKVKFKSLIKKICRTIWTMTGNVWKLFMSYHIHHSYHNFLFEYMLKQSVYFYLNMFTFIYIYHNVDSLPSSGRTCIYTWRWLNKWILKKKKKWFSFT